MTPRLQDGIKETIRVMVVENHQMIAWGLQNLVNGQQPMMKVVATAATQQEAIMKLEEFQPHVVLLKYQLANMADGLTFSRAFTDSGSRILLFTETFDEEMVQITLRSGAHGLLTGNSSPDEIIKAIEKTYRGELWFGREFTRMVVNALRAPGEQKKSHAPGEILAELTPRERKVLQAVIENKVRTNKGLAKQLFISESTLRNHLSSIYQKLGVGNRLDLYVYAHDHGLNFAAEHRREQRAIHFGQFEAA
jgi:DNA-binding NarL/FixJ family response regulator